MIRLMFIVPYEEMKQEIAQLIGTFPCEEQIEYRCVLHTYIDLHNYKQDWPCDAIIARGYSADVIAAQHKGIPVIKINFNSIDAINAIQACRERFHSKRIAIIGHPSLAIASESIHKICDIPISIYTMNGLETDIQAIVHTALRDGNDTIIGGGTACRYAEKLHVNNYNSLTNRETLYSAVNEAVQTVQIQRQERIKSQTLQTVMDNSGEGFILTNVDGIISVCNRFVEMLFHTEMEEIVGKPYSQFLPELLECFSKVVKTGHPAENEIFRNSGRIYVANMIPIIMDGAIESILIDCHDISNIQKMESQIRKKLFAKGMVTKYQFGDIIYQNAQLGRLIESAKKFASVDSNILIYGETGVGKELLAQSIHTASHRSNRPFVAVNCAAIPENLLESEMFGYTAGAFTGSSKEGKQGLFELAHSGTLFLDEVGELPYSFQGKLLRVLQEHEIRKIGDDRVIPVDVRIIAAANQNLETMISQNKFRRDLYFRLNVLSLVIPPLRQRPEDIVPIFQSFLQSYAVKFKKSMPVLEESAKALLQSYEWIGNIRELRNVAERFMVLYTDECDVTAVLADSIFPSGSTSLSEKALTEEATEQERIRSAIQMSENREEAAAHLGISRSTLWRKMKQYGLQDASKRKAP